MERPNYGSDDNEGCIRSFVVGWYLLFGAVVVVGIGMFGFRSAFTIGGAEDLLAKGLLVLVLLLPLFLWWERRRK